MRMSFFHCTFYMQVTNPSPSFFVAANIMQIADMTMTEGKFLREKPRNLTYINSQKMQFPQAMPTETAIVWYE